MSRHGDVFVASGRTQSAYTSKPVSSGPTSAIWPPGSVQVCRRRARVGLGLATSGRPASTHPGPALRLGDARPPRVRAGLPRYLRAACGRIPVSTAVIKFEAFDSEPITLCFPAGPSSLPSLPRSVRERRISFLTWPESAVGCIPVCFSVSAQRIPSGSWLRGWPCRTRRGSPSHHAVENGRALVRQYWEPDELQVRHRARPGLNASKNWFAV